MKAGMVLKSVATVEYFTYCLFNSNKNVSCQGEFLQFGSLIWLPNFSARLLPIFIWRYYSIYLLWVDVYIIYGRPVMILDDDSVLGQF